MTHVRIRPVQPGEHADWLPLWRGYLHFYEALIADAVTALTWQRFFDEREPMFAALAWHGARAVGLVHYLRHRSTWSARPYCYLGDLFVDPVARGGGIGAALITYVYEAAEQNGDARVYWTTHETNARARALYDRVAQLSGFVQYRHDVVEPTPLDAEVTQQNGAVEGPQERRAIG